MKVGNFCNRDVVITDRDTSILDAAKLMRHHHVGDIVVVENLSKGNIPIGIINDRETYTPLSEAINQRHMPNRDELRIARILSI